MMRTKAGFIVALLFATQVVHAQGLGGYLNQAENALKNNGNTAPKSGNTGTGTQQNNTTGNQSTGAKTDFSGLTKGDMTGALRQALQVGAKNASDRLSAPNGFFGNALIKILMPPDAKKVESTLRQAGLGDQVDQAILAMNRAAEDASAKAVPIFVDAITHMSIQDALSILQGGNTAATAYLKTKTSPALTAAFRPVIEASLKKVQATQYWNEVFSTYNKLPLVRNKINPDLPAYVTDRALNGLFVALSEEEAKIRLDPAAQVSDLLRKVFGKN